MSPSASASRSGSVLSTLNTAFRPQAPPTPPDSRRGSQQQLVVPEALQKAWQQGISSVVGSLQEQYRQLHCQQQKDKAALDNCTEDLHKKNEKIRQLEEQIRHSDDNQQHLTLRCQTIEQERAALEQNSRTTQNDLETKLNNANTKASQLQTENSRLQDRLQSALERQAQASSKQKHEKMRLVLVGARLTGVYAPKLEKLAQDNMALRALCGDHQRANEVLEGERHEMLAKVEDVERSNAYLRTQLTQKEHESEDHATEVGGLKDRCEEVKEELRVKTDEYGVEKKLHTEKTIKLEACKKDLESERHRMREETQKAADLAKQLKDQENRYARQKDAIDRMGNDLRAKGDKISDVTKQLSAVNDQATSAAHNAAKCLEAQKGAEKKLEVKERKIEEAEARAAAAEAKSQRMQAALERSAATLKRAAENDDDEEENTAPPAKKQCATPASKQPLKGPARRPSHTMSIPKGPRAQQHHS